MDDYFEVDEADSTPPLARVIIASGRMWGFHHYKDKKERHLNNLAHQAFLAKEVMKKYGDIFKEIQTGSDGKVSKADRKKLGIPLKYVKGVSKRVLYFIFKDDYEENKEDDEEYDKKRKAEMKV